MGVVRFKKKQCLFLNMKKSVIMFLLITAIILSGVASAELDIERQYLLEYGKVLYIKNITIEPSEVAPGNEALLKIKIKNIDKYFLRDVVVALELPESFAPAIGELPYKKIRTIEAYETLDLYFRVLALPDAEPGVYTAKLSISYLNSVGDVVNETREITLIMAGQPELIAYVSDSELYKEKRAGEVTISIANKGLSKAKLLTAELKKSKDYEILSSRKKYVGDLESDDFEEISFLIKLKTKETSVKLPLILEYRDEMNKQHKKELMPELKIYSIKEISPESQTKKILLIVVIIVLLVYFIRKRKHSKKKE